MIYFSFDVDITNSEEATVVTTDLKQLLEKNETEVKKLMAQIAAILTPDYQKVLQTMDKPQLINEIRKILFKTKQLETSKGEVVKENLKIKASEMEKYKKMLIEVK